MSDIFREVDEDVRHDEYKRLWDRYGVYVIGAGLAIILGVGGYKGWQAYQKNQAENAGRTYMSAITEANSGDDVAATKLLDSLSSGGPAGYGLLARFKMASIQAGKGNIDQAVKAYDAIAGSLGKKSPLGELAQVRSAMLLLDTAGRGEIEKRMKPLDQAGGPWRNSARELLALAAFRASDPVAANKYFEIITTDPAAPANVRRRARLMIALLKSELAARGLGEAAK